MILIGFKDKSLKRFKSCFGKLFEDFKKYLKTYNLFRTLCFLILNASKKTDEFNFLSDSVELPLNILTFKPQKTKLKNEILNSLISKIIYIYSLQMKFEIVKLNKFDGNKCGIYSVFIDNEQKTLFDRFLLENKILFKSEIADILERIKTINRITGAREKFFRLNEGNPGDGICALFDLPNCNLRLYCIRFGNSLIILGGGGEKQKSVKAFQEVNKLKDENYLLREISAKISGRIKEKEITFLEKGTEITGELEFDKYD